MQNPKYLVNIYYQPLQMTGQEKVSISGTTYSLPTYSGNYFVASMPEVKIVATGSSYNTALTNLLNIATASTTDYPGYPPLSFS
jgi:hypothetical protein